MLRRLCVQQPQIILLKDGTDTSQGKAQLISNINACCAVVDAVRTTLGPRGMDKLIHDQKVGNKCSCPTTPCLLACIWTFQSQLPLLSTI